MLAFTHSCCSAVKILIKDIGIVKILIKISAENIYYFLINNRASAALAFSRPVNPQSFPGLISQAVCAPWLGILEVKPSPNL